jgi:hypothetical protein
MPEPMTVAEVLVATERPPAISRWFYIGVALFMIAFNAVAFAPSIVDSSGRNVPLPFTPLVMAHTIVSVAWLVLFLVQTALVATARTDVHRRLGIAGAVLTVAFVVIGCFAVVVEARRGFDLGGDISRLPDLPGVDPVARAVGILFFFLVFAILVGAALWYRPSVHKRLMLLAVLGGLTPTPMTHVVGHWTILHPWGTTIFAVGFLICLSFSPIHDRVTEGRIHPVSLWGAVLVFLANVLFSLAIVPSAAWDRFARWLAIGQVEIR